MIPPLSVMIAIKRVILRHHYESHATRKTARNSDEDIQTVNCFVLRISVRERGLLMS